MSLISQMASEETTDMDASLRWHDGIKAGSQPPETPASAGMTS
jgi:hypothetical protein